MSSPAELTRLVRRYDERLRKLAFRLLGDRDRMDDVLQEAYVKAYRALPTFSGDASAGTWLYRIVYNTCLDELRRRRRRPTDSLGDRDVLSPEVSVEDRFSERNRLADAFDALTAEQKTVVWLVDVEGLDYAAAADVLGIAPGTVGSRLSRAHGVLRELLEEDP